MIRMLVGLGLVVLVLATPAQATIIPVVLHFSDPSWSGVVSFDDTTGQTWVPNVNFPILGITAYAITDMNISDGVHTWTEDELDPAKSLPPTFGLLVDPYGTVAYFAEATDADTGGVTLYPYVQYGRDAFDVFMLLGTWVSLNPSFQGPDYEYTASVPAPATLLLLTSGLAALSGIAWRRRR
jgi:hypothetical protein